MQRRAVAAATVTAALFASAAAALALFAPPTDPDLFWHLASADWMLAHGRLLDHDVFSFTRSGAAYQSGQWLGEIALGVAFRSGGWFGIVVLRAILIGIGIFFMSRAVLRLQPHVAWATVPIVGLILESRTIWGDRPQLWSLAIFPLVLDLLLATRLDGNTRRLVLLPPIFLLWANLHGAFTAGLALVVVFVVEAVLGRVVALRGPLALAGGASLLAALLNPAGLGAIVAGASYASATAGTQVMEEGPLDILTPRGAILAAFLLISFFAALLLGREGTAQRVGPSALLWAGLIVPFALLGLAIQRQAPFACAAIAPFAAAAVPAMLGRVRTVAPLLPLPFAAAVMSALGVALLLLAAVAAPREPDLATYPAGALDSLAAASGNLFNEYDWGGYLIAAAPSHPVFIDGRGWLLYVPGVLADFDEAVRLRPGYRAVLDRWDIRLVLLRPDRPLAVALREQGWRVLGEGGATWVLLQRP